MSGGRGKRAALQDMQVEGLTEKEYGMVKLKNVGDVLFQALLFDDVRTDDKNIYADFYSIYVG